MKQKEDDGVGVRKRIEKPDSKRAGGKSVESVEEIGFGLTRKGQKELKAVGGSEGEEERRRRI